MASLEMSGPYDFGSQIIDQFVSKKSAGNYGLGSANSDGTFFVKYVGRSDGDLNAELKTRLATAYRKFKFSYATSPKDAFIKECRNFHDFGGTAMLDNKIHPARPANADWKCPNCKAFG